MTMIIEEKPKVTLLKLKNSRETKRSDFLKSTLQGLALEFAKTREEVKQSAHTVESKGKQPLHLGNKKLVVKVNEEVAKIAKPLANMQFTFSSDEQEKGNGEQQKSDAKTNNGIEEGKDKGKSLDMGKVHGKDSGGVRDLIEGKDKDIYSKRGRAKGKRHFGKSAFLKLEGTLPLHGASKVMPKLTTSIQSSTHGGTLSSLRQSLKKKVIQTKTMTTTTTKTVTEQKKVRRAYSLLGQKHDAPNDRDPLRIFYSTLRDQMPHSQMAKFWLMENGLLPQEEAKMVLVQKQQQGQSLKHATCSKSSTPSQVSNGSPTKNKFMFLLHCNNKSKDVGTLAKGKNKRVYSESDSDNFLLHTHIKKKLKA